MLPHPKMLSMQEDLRQCARSATKAVGQLLQTFCHYKVIRLMMIWVKWTDDGNSDNQTKVQNWWQFFFLVTISRLRSPTCRCSRDIKTSLSSYLKVASVKFLNYNNERVTRTSNEILTSETVRGVISVLRSLLCALLFNWVIGRETKAGGNLRSRSLPHFPYLLRAWKQNHLSDRKDILVKSCEVCF